MATAGPVEQEVNRVKVLDGLGERGLDAVFVDDVALDGKDSCWGSLG